jgi:single-strand selective monofunctional uracil DNA glycosylase
MSLVPVARRLGKEVGSLRFGPPVACVYNPLEYAWDAHRTYLERFARPAIEVLFVGMNPGPFGMAQTGVPFGEVASVRSFLGIDSGVRRPALEHPKRPILGFDCPRSEVSGARVWGWVRDRFGSPEAFFTRCFIWNWCPLSFMLESGANLTPDKLPAAERTSLESACDGALRSVVGVLGPRLVIGFGGFASDRARKALGSNGPAIGTVLHPSPASPAANRGWVPALEAQLTELGVDLAGVKPRTRRTTRSA